MKRIRMFFGNDMIIVFPCEEYAIPFLGLIQNSEIMYIFVVVKERIIITHKLILFKKVFTSTFNCSCL